MLRLQEKFDTAMRSKGENWRHRLGEPVTGIIKQKVHYTPPKLRLIRERGDQDQGLSLLHPPGN